MNENLFRALVHLAVKQARTITDDQEALEIKCFYKEPLYRTGNSAQCHVQPG